MKKTLKTITILVDKKAFQKLELERVKKGKFKQNFYGEIFEDRAKKGKKDGSK